MWLGHRAHCGRGDGGVDGGTAILENSQARRGGEMVIRRDETLQAALGRVRDAIVRRILQPQPRGRIGATTFEDWFGLVEKHRE